MGLAVIYSGPQNPILESFLKCPLLVSDQSDSIVQLIWERGTKSLIAEQILIYEGIVSSFSGFFPWFSK